MCKICLILTDFSYSPRSSGRCARSLSKKLRPEFYQNCNPPFFFIFFTVQLKIQIFFQCLHWRLFCSAPLHRCLGFVAGRGLMHFMLNNTLLGCSGREGEQKSSFCGTKGHCWQLVRSVRARTRLCKPVSQTVTPMWVCDPTHVPVHCQGGGCTDSESHPGFAAIPAAHTGLVCCHSCRCSHRTDRNAFSPKPHREK